MGCSGKRGAEWVCVRACVRERIHGCVRGSVRACVRERMHECVRKRVRERVRACMLGGWVRGWTRRANRALGQGGR
jgi:hypothetical protein